MAEREEFPFSVGSLGITSTELVDAGENFLNSDPNNIKLLGSQLEETAEEEDEEGEEEEGTTAVKKPAAKKKFKTVIAKSRQLSDDDTFSLLGDAIEGAKDNAEGEEEGAEELPVGTKKPVTKKVEVKEPVTEEETSTETGEEGSEQAAETNTYSAIAAELFNQGIFQINEDEELEAASEAISTPEAFLQRFQAESSKQASFILDQFLGSKGDEYKQMFDSVFVKGVPPIEYLNRYAKIENIKGIDITGEENQERIVRELYRSEGRSAEYIEKKMLQHKNYNDLATEAEEAQKILIKNEEVAIQKAAATKQQQMEAEKQIRTEYVGSVGKILTDKRTAKEYDGIPVDGKTADETFAYLTDLKFKLDGRLITEFDKDIIELSRPANHGLKVKLGLLLRMLKTDPNLTTLAKKAVSKENNELFKGLKKNQGKSGASTVAVKAKTEATNTDGKPKSFFEN